MGRLPNNFAFSFSKYKNFRGCARSWWLASSAHWNGWDSRAPEAARLAYRLTKLSSYYRVAGDQVHAVLHDAVINHRLTLPQALARYETGMRDAYAQAKGNAWREDPKRNCNLFEVYYGVANETTAHRALERGRAAIETAFSMPELERARAGRLIEAEGLKRIVVDGIPIWVKTDLVFQEGDVYHIWDWKTGRPKEEDRAQAALYGLYGHLTLGAPAGNIVFTLIYLRDREVEENIASDDDLRQLREAIVTAGREMQALLPDPRFNVAPVDRFPRTTDRTRCQECDFFHACRGHKDLSRPELVADGWDEQLAALPWAPGERR